KCEYKQVVPFRSAGAAFNSGCASFWKINIERPGVSVSFSRDNVHQLHHGRFDKLPARGDLSCIESAWVRGCDPISAATNKQTAGIEHCGVESIRPVGRGAEGSIHGEIDSG